MSQGRRERRHVRRAVIGAVLGATALFLGGAVVGPVAPAGAVPPTFTKAFLPPEIPSGGASTLTYTINNAANVTDTTGLAFTDTLPAAITPSPPTTDCTNPGGTTLTLAANLLTFTGWTVDANSSCTVTVPVTSSTPGTHTSTTSTLASSDPGSPSPAVSGSLIVAAVPPFSKAFSPDSIDPLGVSTLTFTIDNTGNGIEASNIDFTDPLPTVPDAMTIATDADTSQCGGTVTALAGEATITFADGIVAAGATCTVSVDVTAPLAGSYENTSETLTSNLGGSGTATDTLVVTPLVVSKTFVEGSIQPGGTATFNITVRNDGTEDLSNVVATDALATECNRTFTTLVVDATETYTCALAGVASSFTNTVVVAAEGATSGVVVTAEASAEVVVAAVPATTIPPGPALAATGGPKTSLLAAIGIGVLLIGAALAIASSDRRRLFRFRR